jgi:hypothetical protein
VKAGASHRIQDGRVIDAARVVVPAIAGAGKLIGGKGQTGKACRSASSRQRRLKSAFRSIRIE